MISKVIRLNLLSGFMQNIYDHSNGNSPLEGSPDEVGSGV